MAKAVEATIQEREPAQPAPSITRQDVREIVGECLRVALVPVVTRASVDELQYLEERGWLEADGGDYKCYGFIDMMPPPDRVMVTGTLRDERTGKRIRDVEQLVTGGAVGQFHSLKDALWLEKKRAREPLPLHHLHEGTGNPPFHKDFQPIHLQKWYVRDRQRRVVNGPYETKEEAQGAVPNSID